MTAKRRFPLPKAARRLREINSSRFAEPVLRRSSKSPRRPKRTTGISGTEIATISFTTRTPTERRITITQAHPTSTLMAPGPKFPTTDRFGFLKLIMAGHPIEMAVGSGSRTGVGLGFLMSLGAGRHITMGAGSSGVDHGPGGPARFTRLISRFGLPHTYLSSDLAEAWASTSALDSAPLAGFRLGPATSSIRGGAVLGIALES